MPSSASASLLGLRGNASKLLNVALAASCLALADGRAFRSSLRNSTAGATAAVQNQTQLPPKIYFLFLAVDKVSNLDIWSSFFATAPADQYRAFIHCKYDSCKQQVAGTPLQVVQTVPSYYCTDLVSPMNQLLSYALQDGARQGYPSASDKFAFVSDSTLPAKPFSQMYETFRMRQGSDFCVFPSNEWADIPGPQGLQIAPKAHQWINLNRAHAEKALHLWSQGHFHNFMTLFRMNSNPYAVSNNSFADSRNFGCLDEFWYMATLYGPLQHNIVQAGQQVALSMFDKGPLLISAQAGWQGECDTFVMWSQYLNTPGNNPFYKFHSTLDSKSIPHGGNFARPGWWDSITTHGLRAIRQSSFLFVRKFVDQPHLYDGPSFAESFKQLVLMA